jgi:proteasome accessory factor C
VQVVAPESLAVAVRDTALGALAMYEQVRP